MYTRGHMYVLNPKPDTYTFVHGAILPFEMEG